jgi:hypothetical protein
VLLLVTCFGLELNNFLIGLKSLIKCRVNDVLGLIVVVDTMEARSLVDTLSNDSRLVECDDEMGKVDCTRIKKIIANLIKYILEYCGNN